MSEEDLKLIGEYVLLSKKDHDLGRILDAEYVGFKSGKLHKMLDMEWPSTDDPDRHYKALMSVNPDKLIQVVEEFRKIREEYSRAHKELLDFIKKHPEIPAKTRLQY